MHGHLQMRVDDHARNADELTSDEKTSLITDLLEHIEAQQVELDAANIELAGWHGSAIYHRREDGGWDVGLRDTEFVGELLKAREREG